MHRRALQAKQALGFRFSARPPVALSGRPCAPMHCQTVPDRLLIRRAGVARLLQPACLPTARASSHQLSAASGERCLRYASIIWPDLDVWPRAGSQTAAPLRQGLQVRCSAVSKDAPGAAVLQMAGKRLAVHYLRADGQYKVCARECVHAAASMLHAASVCRAGACTCGETSKQRRAGATPCRPGTATLRICVCDLSASLLALRDPMRTLLSAGSNTTALTASESVLRSGNNGQGLSWEVELLPDAARNNFTHWCGFIVHKGAQPSVSLQPCIKATWVPPMSPLALPRCTALHPAPCKLRQ